MNDLKRIIVVALALITLCIFAWNVKAHIDSAGYRKQVNYTTAVQPSSKDDFNYAIDSQQGRVLYNGVFSTENKERVKFDEMNRYFTFVRRVKEHYTMHTRTVCTGSGKTEECHTETYYTWDEVDREEKSAQQFILNDRKYNVDFFNLEAFIADTDACAITAQDTSSGWFSAKHGCSSSAWGGQYYYLNNDDRYYYQTVPTTFNATFLATTTGGKLQPFEEGKITLQDKSVKQALVDVGKYQLVSFWVAVTLIVLLFTGACVAAYYWVMADGYWSMDE